MRQACEVVAQIDAQFERRCTSWHTGARRRCTQRMGADVLRNFQFAAKIRREPDHEKMFCGLRAIKSHKVFAKINQVDLSEQEKHERHFKLLKVVYFGYMQESFFYLPLI